MNRYNFKIVEKWQTYWDKNKTYKAKIDKTKNSTAWKCFPIRPVKFTWVM